VCAGKEELRLSDLKGQELGARIAFFNACQSARARGVDIPDSSRSFAEYFLRAGVDASKVGTRVAPTPKADDATPVSKVS